MLERFPVQLRSDLSCSTCAVRLRNLPHFFFHLVSFKDGAVRHQTSESEKNVAFVLSLTLKNTFCPFPRDSASASCLLRGSFFTSILKFRSMRAARSLIPVSESHLAKDPFFPEFSRGVMLLLGLARFASVPRIWCLHKFCISEALHSGIRKRIAWNSSIRQQSLYHLFFSVFSLADCQRFVAEDALFTKFASRLCFVMLTFGRTPTVTCFVHSPLM